MTEAPKRTAAIFSGDQEEWLRSIFPEFTSVFFTVTKPPKGTPTEISQTWIGVSMAGFHVECPQVDLTTQEQIARGAYAVPVADALAALAISEEGQIAVHWYDTHLPPDLLYLTFGEDEISMNDDTA